MDPINAHLRGHRLHRRGFLQCAGLAGVSWLTPLGHLLARAAERTREPARSVILLWLGGGPSQLETFDPHPGSKTAYDSKAIGTRIKGVQLGEGFAGLAEMMDSVSLVRSMVSQEGDHERGIYLMKTGYRPDPTVEHASIGAICCHELPLGKTEIPRHISILPGRWPGRGGFLGDEFDAFKIYDPAQRLPDVTARVDPQRDAQRLKDLDLVEQAFSRGRSKRLEKTQHRDMVQRARTMMSSSQLKAFDITQEPLALQKTYGETPFGRGCLAARRLLEVGVRCIEVTLDGWDSHANNHSTHKERIAALDPAFSALIGDLKARNLLDKTVVLCAGEFGRTPKMNPASGRDHWPKGFSIALAGGGIHGGRVVGGTDPDGGELKDDAKNGIHTKNFADVHATVLSALGLDITKNYPTPAQRPIQMTKGRPFTELLDE